MMLSVMSVTLELCVQLVKDKRNPYNNDLYTYCGWSFITPRNKEFFDLIQTMRQMVLKSSKYKEMLELVYGDDPPKELYG